MGLFKKKDPVCGMKEIRKEGITKHNKWFCSNTCLTQFENARKKDTKTRGCCGQH
jgi:YHS domain-containing protein